VYHKDTRVTLSLFFATAPATPVGAFKEAKIFLKKGWGGIERN
jgi:hypothetical protein